MPKHTHEIPTLISGEVRTGAIYKHTSEGSEYKVFLTGAFAVDPIDVHESRDPSEIFHEVTQYESEGTITPVRLNPAREDNSVTMVAYENLERSARYPKGTVWTRTEDSFKQNFKLVE